MKHELLYCIFCRFDAVLGKWGSGGVGDAGTEMRLGRDFVGLEAGSRAVTDSHTVQPHIYIRVTRMPDDQCSLIAIMIIPSFYFAFLAK